MPGTGAGTGFETNKTVMGSDDSMLASAVTPDLTHNSSGGGSWQKAKRNIGRVKMF